MKRSQDLIALPPAAMSIDVEDWFQVENLKSVVDRASWDRMPLRVERNMDWMLARLDDAGVKCTCFVLGWIAEKCPTLVRRIAAAGHEIASHGYGHELIYKQDPRVFREDLRKSVGLLGDLVGDRPLGYRAPSFSITDWALDILVEEGFEYDSSLFPVAGHDRYGNVLNRGDGETIFPIRPNLCEVTLACLPITGFLSVPWAGGGYFRLFPYPLFRWGVRRILASGNAFVFYIHPWEIDADQPRVAGLSWSHRFRHYNNLRVCQRRWAELLVRYDWIPIGELLKQTGELLDS